MNDRYFKAARAADALSLGPHWVYNQGRLAQVYPDGITAAIDPQSPYHPNRKAGQLTHYGDQMVFLKNSLEGQSYDREKWRQDWLSGMTGYDGYLDGGTRETLASKGESPSDSNDLAGASRLAPILDLDLSPHEKVAAARSQTALTHGDEGVIEAAEFFVRAVLAAEKGKSFENAFRTAVKEGHYTCLKAEEDLNKALTAGPDSLAAGTKIGLSCHLPEAFPLALYFALREGATFQTAVSENGLAGGDTSARSMLFALLFAARGDEIGESSPT
jgi:ADP-ribosylglycohydrolase